jgi:ATP-dependent Lon protease
MTEHERQTERPIHRIPETLPVLPLRDTVVFPFAVVPISVGQQRSVQLVDDAMKGDRLIAMVHQILPEVVPAGPGDVHRVGTAAVVHQLLRAPDGSLQLLVQGVARIRITDFVQTEPYLVAKVQPAPEQTEAGLDTEGLARSVRTLFRRLVELMPDVPDEIGRAVELLEDATHVAYMVAAVAPIPTSVRQEILELDAVDTKLRRIINVLQHDIAVRELGQKIAVETREQVSKAQREYYLREQMRAIQRELGEGDGEHAGVQELRDLVEKAALPDEAKRESERELSRLERTPAASPEHGLIRTYLEWMVSLPWNKLTGEVIDVERARKVLDDDHHDLEKVKDRIVEYLGVKKLRQARGMETPEGRAHEPILCFVGPPGVGKTSLGQSIAHAMGRRFVRLSLGGIHDEAEIRGHRRTYIGAMPGRIIQALRRGETADPVFMLDEVDKLGVGIHGDPSAALLEVLDPAQNQTFVDTYLNVPFDLSSVLFICTANTTETIPPALLDRMEVLNLEGYTEEEKLLIARRYLLPKQLAAHGLREGELSIDDDAIRRTIRLYTREAGVRNLDRSLAAICRKTAKTIAGGRAASATVTPATVEELLGPQKFFPEMVERIDRPGVATGLAWTPSGGELLFIEAAVMPSKRNRMIITGSLGDVMRESAEAALSCVRSRADELKLGPDAFEDKDIHIHVPSGAIPKDGPSAGITITTALASAVTGRRVRQDVAMTGEITLRGKVLPIGGVKAKALAAHRAGIRTVILPKGNARDLDTIPEELRKDLDLITVDTIEEVLDRSLEPAPRPSDGQATATPAPTPAEGAAKRA